MALTPDGRRALSGSDALQVPEVQGLLTLRTFEGYTDSIHAVALATRSPAQRTTLCACGFKGRNSWRSHRWECGSMCCGGDNLTIVAGDSFGPIAFPAPWKERINSGLISSRLQKGLKTSNARKGICRKTLRLSMLVNLGRENRNNSITSTNRRSYKIGSGALRWLTTPSRSPRSVSDRVVHRSRVVCA